MKELDYSDYFILWINVSCASIFARTKLKFNTGRPNNRNRILTMGTAADPDNFFNSSQLRSRFCSRIQYQLLKCLPKTVSKLPHIHQENGLLPESRGFVPGFNFWQIDAGSMDPQQRLGPTNATELQKRLFSCQFEHWLGKAVCVWKQSCHSTRSNNFLQQEESPNLEDKSNKKIHQLLLCFIS